MFPVASFSPTVLLAAIMLQAFSVILALRTILIIAEIVSRVKLLTLIVWHAIHNQTINAILVRIISNHCFLQTRIHKCVSTVTAFKMAVELAQRHTSLLPAIQLLLTVLLAGLGLFKERLSVSLAPSLFPTVLLVKETRNSMLFAQLVLTR